MEGGNRDDYGGTRVANPDERLTALVRIGFSHQQTGGFGSFRLDMKRIWETKERSPGPASSSEATRTRSRPPSPSQVAPKRSRQILDQHLISTLAGVLSDVAYAILFSQNVAPDVGRTACSAGDRLVGF